MPEQSQGGAQAACQVRNLPPFQMLRCQTKPTPSGLRSVYSWLRKILGFQKSEEMRKQKKILKVLLNDI